MCCCCCCHCLVNLSSWICRVVASALKFSHSLIVHLAVELMLCTIFLIRCLCALLSSLDPVVMIKAWLVGLACWFLTKNERFDRYLTYVCDHRSSTAEQQQKTHLSSLLQHILIQLHHLVAVHDLLHSRIILQHPTPPNQHRHSGPSSLCAHRLHSPHNVHASEHTTEHNVLVVQVGGGAEQDVELWRSEMRGEGEGESERERECVRDVSRL